MGEELRLELIPTDPTGPAAGDRLEVTGGGVRVVRRGMLGRRRGPLRSLADLRDVAAGAPGDVAAAGWLSPGAQIAAHREAVRPAGQRRHLLALRFAGPVQEEVWLLGGDAGTVASGASLLGGRTPDPLAPPAPDPWGDPVPDAPEGPGTAGDAEAPPDGALRGRARLPAFVPIAVALVLGVVFLWLPGRLEVRADRISDVAPPAAPAPYSVTDVLTLPARRAVRRAGLRPAGPPSSPAGGSGAWTLRLTDGRRVTTVVLHPTPAAAAAAARPRDRRRGNVLIRGGGARAAAAVIAGLGAAGR